MTLPALKSLTEKTCASDVLMGFERIFIANPIPRCAGFWYGLLLKKIREKNETWPHSKGKWLSKYSHSMEHLGTNDMIN